MNGFNLGNDYKAKINKCEIINYTLNIEFWFSMLLFFFYSITL